MSDFYTQMGVGINQTTFNLMDKNGDGKITREEKALFDAELSKSGFDKFDLNGDGVISKAEQQQSTANNIYEKNKLELPTGENYNYSLTRGFGGICTDRNFIKKNNWNINQMAGRIQYSFNKYANRNLDLEIIKKVLKNMPSDVRYWDLNNDGYQNTKRQIRFEDLQVFVELYNKSLQTVSQQEAKADTTATNILSGVNQDAMTMDENGNLVLKSDLVKDKTAKTNTEKLDYDSGSKVIDGLNGKLKTLAESHYTLKKIKFNEKLFNEVFSNAKASVLDKLSKGEITNANQVLEKFVSEFNSKWLEASIVDISRKTNNRFLNRVFGLR